LIKWLKVKALSSNSSITKKEKKERALPEGFFLPIDTLYE
jgi:hypothetical protein